MNDNDRELIELAAKAYGINVKGWINSKLIGFDTNTEQPVNGDWNPLESDGDAFRLACNLRMSINHSPPTEHDAWVSTYVSGHKEEVVYVPPETPIIAVVRRTIVVLAAEIGRWLEA